MAIKASLASHFLSKRGAPVFYIFPSCFPVVDYKYFSKKIARHFYIPKVQNNTSIPSKKGRQTLRKKLLDLFWENLKKIGSKFSNPNQDRLLAQRPAEDEICPHMVTSLAKVGLTMDCGFDMPGLTNSQVLKKILLDPLHYYVVRFFSDNIRSTGWLKN